MTVTVCQSKKFFDTEWEAQLAATRAEFKFGDEMKPYSCGAHWHITHADPELRRGAGHKFTKCRRCREIVKQSKISKHKCERIKA